MIAEYIQNQLKEDIANDQLIFREYIEPFTGSKNQYCENDTVARFFGEHSDSVNIMPLKGFCIPHVFLLAKIEKMLILDDIGGIIIMRGGFL